MVQQKKIIVPLIAIFAVFNGAFLAMKSLLAKWGIDHNILLIANALFFLISLLVFFMQKKAMANSNPNVFIRSVMAGMLIKMFVCISAVLGYKVISDGRVNKVSVFAAMFLYLVYLSAEVSVITKLNKKNNA